MKTRVLYGYSTKTGELIHKEDTLKEALRCNMMVRDYEKQFIELNPQMKCEIKIEKYK